MVPAIIIDLDGTLADTSYKEHLLKGPKPQWDEFFGLIPNDPVNRWCAEIVIGFLQRGYHVIS